MHAAAIENLLPSLLPSSDSSGAAGRRVLDIGSGSGYLTHVLAELVGEDSLVVGVEHIQALRDLGENNMRKSDEGRAFLDNGRVRFRVGDGRKGWVEPGEKEEGWDVIHVGASARLLHPELVAQLRSPGRMFIPVNDDSIDPDSSQTIRLVVKDEKGQVRDEELMAVRYVALTDAPKWSKE
jgi:protein-L-isoaspartate(D-aspartate) O-methyltransferase